MAKLASRVLEARKAYQALELWKRWFKEDGDPWVRSMDDPFLVSCYFCVEDQPNHESGCVYLAAKELVADDKGSVSDEQ